VTGEKAAVLIACIVVLLGTASIAEACPWCNGGPSGINEVKAGIFNATFWMRAAAVLAPFPLFAGIIALIYFGPPNFRVGSKREDDT
jgi:hypothetical protein